MFWKPYVPVAQRRAKALRAMEKRRKKGLHVQPVKITGRVIASSFWGKAWCQHLESFSDYANRLPRGRTYIRNGSVCHLAVSPGQVEAVVSGSELYDINVQIKKLPAAKWRAVKKRCAGHVGSMLELLQGKLSDQVMGAVTDRNGGLFPGPKEIHFDCNCPDWADMCKHVAAVLYAIGSRLDEQPELLFKLRGVDAEELIAAELALPGSADTPAGALADDQLGDIFGIDLDTGANADPVSSKMPQRRKSTVKAKSQTRAKKNATGTTARRPIRTTTVTASRAAQTLPNIRPSGQSVSRLRKRLGLSVAEFAAELGAAPASVYRWEATPQRLKLQARTLQALARLHQQAKQR